MAHKTLCKKGPGNRLHTYEVYWFRTKQRFTIRAKNIHAVKIGIQCRFSIPFVEKEVKIRKVK